MIQNSTLHEMIWKLFLSPIMQTLYKTDCYSNELIGMKNMTNGELELQQSLIFIEKLIQNKAIETYSLLSTYYDIENSCLLHKDLIIEILKWSYDTDKLHKYLGKELLNSKHFTAPVLDLWSFISSVIEPIHIFNVWILITLHIIPHFISVLLVVFVDKNYKLFGEHCSVFGYIINNTMRMQYFLTIIHLLLCQISFVINNIMPLRSFFRWRRYYKIYLNHVYNKYNTTNDTYELDDYEAMKLLLFPYHKLTLHGQIPMNPAMNHNINGFTWATFAESYTLYVFNLYIYNIWSVMYSEQCTWKRKITYYECLILGIYLFPLIYVLCIFDNNWKDNNWNMYVKQKLDQAYICLWNRYVLVTIVAVIISFFVPYIYILMNCLLYLLNFIHIMICIIIGYIHIEWTVRHVFNSVFYQTNSSWKQNILISCNTVAMAIWIISTKTW